MYKYSVYRIVSSLIEKFIDSLKIENIGKIESFNLVCTGLFHKAIIQSGVALNPWAIISEKPSKYGFQLAAKLGETSTDPETVVEFLRTIDAKKLVDLETKLLTPKVSLAKGSHQIQNFLVL